MFLRLHLKHICFFTRSLHSTLFCVFTQVTETTRRTNHLRLSIVLLVTCLPGYKWPSVNTCTHRSTMVEFLFSLPPSSSSPPFFCRLSRLILKYTLANKCLLCVYWYVMQIVIHQTSHIVLCASVCE